MAVELLIRDTDGAYIPDIIGTSSVPITLTTAYADNQIALKANEYNTLVLYVYYTPAADSRVCYVQVEGSADGTNYAQKIIFKDEITGESTMLGHIAKVAGATASETYKKRYVIYLSDMFIRIGVKEDGSSSFGTCFVQANAQSKRLV